MTSLEALAVAARDFGTLERRLFEVLGGWVPTVAEPEAKILLRAHSFQHAWHAELWDGIAPRTGPRGGVDGPGAELVAMLKDRASARSTVDRLAGAYTVVLPPLVGTYRRMRDASTPASDGPLVRVLDLIVTDEEAALAAGQLLLDGMVGTPERGETVAAGTEQPAVRGIRSP